MRATSSGWSTGEATSDGAGVKLTRVLTQTLQRRLDPFLMLDAFGTDNPQDYIGGFPDHPHRGFETVTYMIAGRMRHRDSAGHEGLLSNGGVQWMTAGKGVIHSELPEQEDGRMEGFQLWLNLPAKDKLRAPWYRDIQSAEIPEFTTDGGVKVRVIAGASHGVEGAMQREITEPLYLDLELPAGASLRAGAAGRRTTRSSTSIAAASRSARRTCRRSGWRSSATATDRDGVVLQARSPVAGAADRRQAARRADRAVRAVRDEHARRDRYRREGLPGREVRGLRSAQPHAEHLMLPLPQREGELRVTMRRTRSSPWCRTRRRSAPCSRGP